MSAKVPQPPPANSTGPYAPLSPPPPPPRKDSDSVTIYVAGKPVSVTREKAAFIYQRLLEIADEHE